MRCFKIICVLISLLIVPQSAFCGKDKTIVKLNDQYLAKNGYEYTDSIIIIEQSLVLKKPLQLHDSELQGSVEEDSGLEGSFEEGSGLEGSCEEGRGLGEILAYVYKKFDDTQLKSDTKLTVKLSTLSPDVSNGVVRLPKITPSSEFKEESLLILSGNIKIRGIVLPAKTGRQTPRPFSTLRDYNSTISLNNTFLSLSYLASQTSRIPENFEIKRLSRKGSEALTQKETSDVTASEIKTTAVSIDHSSISVTSNISDEWVPKAISEINAEPSLPGIPGQASFKKPEAEQQNTFLEYSSPQQSLSQRSAAPFLVQLIEGLEKDTSSKEWTAIKKEVWRAIADKPRGSQPSQGSTKVKPHKVRCTSAQSITTSENLHNVQSLNSEKLTRQKSFQEPDIPVSSVLSWQATREDRLKETNKLCNSIPLSTRRSLWEEKIKAAKSEKAQATNPRAHFMATRDKQQPPPTQLHLLTSGKQHSNSSNEPALPDSEKDE